MPTVLRIGPYRFFFYSNEGNEPAHIHVEAGGKLAKYWRFPVSLADNIGYNQKELNEIAKVVQQNRKTLAEAWREHFGHGTSPSGSTSQRCHN